jgi:hypothetical protein
VLANANINSAITAASSAQQIYENVEANAAYKRLMLEILAEIDEILKQQATGDCSKILRG